MALPSFKETVEQDIHNIFLNTNEFAENLDVKYSDREYNIPVVIDRDVSRERGRLSNDSNAGGQRVQGIFISELVAYISFTDLGIVPNKNTPIWIDGDKYNIVNVSSNMGMITLDLEEYDE